MQLQSRFPLPSLVLWLCVVCLIQFTLATTYVKPTIVDEKSFVEDLAQNEAIDLTNEYVRAHFVATPLSFVELESQITRQNLDDEYEENDPADHHHHNNKQHSGHEYQEEDEDNNNDNNNDNSNDNEEGYNRHHHRTSHHHNSRDNYHNDRFQETQQQQQRHQQQHTITTTTDTTQLLGTQSPTDPATTGATTTTTTTASSSSAAASGSGSSESGEFGPCKTCVFVLERIKKGTNMLLPAICSEIYIQFPDAYAMCHQVLNALSLNGNNVRYWLFEGCYKYEIYQAKEWVKPCPSHVMCTVLKTLRNTPFCHPLPMENPFADDPMEAGEGSQPAGSSSSQTTTAPATPQ